MNKKFCPECGTPNDGNTIFCINCGFKFPSSEPFPPSTQPKVNSEVTTFDSISNNEPQSNANIWATLIIILLIIGSIVGIVIHQNPPQTTEQKIKSCVVAHTAKDDYKVMINKSKKAIGLEAKDSDIIDSMEQMVDKQVYYEEDADIQSTGTKISKSIKQKVGSGWTLIILNPENSDRELWRYKDGNLDYAVEDDF
ncbi:zinc ribbon domain-containing protein [Furfurilactobacillus milii]|uniref:Zinc-ribbon domain-containing protein n=1 Tax=Furfurilactobacillus rossiae TaxID=231049 RepID=A0A7C9MRS1_9LACO|nr:zinc ribbon domain-containing protein [Furfurilactobacillus milii]MYV05408.1 hypothetical protein [Furfurilactobacillus milii]